VDHTITTIYELVNNTFVGPRAHDLTTSFDAFNADYIIHMKRNASKRAWYEEHFIYTHESLIKKMPLFRLQAGGRPL
jgi:hypothetical protein